MQLELQAFCGIATLVKASRRGGTTDNHGRLTLWSGQLISGQRLVFGGCISAGTEAFVASQRRFLPGDSSEDETIRQGAAAQTGAAVNPARCFPGSIETGNGMIIAVKHLCFGADGNAARGVMNGKAFFAVICGCRPKPEEWDSASAFSRKCTPSCVLTALRNMRFSPITTATTASISVSPGRRSAK